MGLGKTQRSRIVNPFSSCFPSAVTISVSSEVRDYWSITSLHKLVCQQPRKQMISIGGLKIKAQKRHSSWELQKCLCVISLWGHSAVTSAARQGEHGAAWGGNYLSSRLNHVLHWQKLEFPSETGAQSKINDVNWIPQLIVWWLEDKGERSLTMPFLQGNDVLSAITCSCKSVQQSVCDDCKMTSTDQNSFSRLAQKVKTVWRCSECHTEDKQLSCNTSLLRNPFCFLSCFDSASLTVVVCSVCLTPVCFWTSQTARNRLG